MQYVMETYGKEDMYPSEFVVSDEHGHSCVVTTEWLYQAMTKLKECQKEVLILEFWYEFSGHTLYTFAVSLAPQALQKARLNQKEVAELFSVSETTISQWKRKAFNFIRDYYERKHT